MNRGFQLLHLGPRAAFALCLLFLLPSLPFPLFTFFLASMEQAQEGRRVRGLALCPPFGFFTVHITPFRSRRAITLKKKKKKNKSPPNSHKPTSHNKRRSKSGETYKYFLTYTFLPPDRYLLKNVSFEYTDIKTCRNYRAPLVRRSELKMLSQVCVLPLASSI